MKKYQKQSFVDVLQNRPCFHKCCKFHRKTPMLESLQGCREGTSSVAFEVLTMNYETDFTNLFIFNYLVSNMNLFIVSCLALNINLFIFNCLTSNFCFPKNIYFASRRERLFMDVRLHSRILNSPGKMMTCYLRDTNKSLRHRTLCTSILKCGFPTKGTELTRLVLFEVLRVPQL